MASLENSAKIAAERLHLDLDRRQQLATSGVTSELLYSADNGQTYHSFPPNMPLLSVKKLHPNAILPKKGSQSAAGFDLYAVEDQTMQSGLGFPTKVKTGIAMAIPEYHVGMIKDRSSMAAKGLQTSAGIIDSDYRGEIAVLISNLTENEYTIKQGDKIAQILIMPISHIDVVEEVDDLSVTARGQGGFGSTGK